MRWRPMLLLAPLDLFSLLVAPAAAVAQRRESQQGSVSQMINGATITIEYYRPVARGRDQLFGKVVRWGREWTPGANWATTFDVDRDVLLNGHAVSKGRYSVWMIPQHHDEWTVLLNRKARRFHTDRPQGKEEVLSFTVAPRDGPHMETLAWYFPDVADDSATLVMHWGTTIVPLSLVVPGDTGSEVVHSATSCRRCARTPLLIAVAEPGAHRRTLHSGV